MGTEDQGTSGEQIVNFRRVMQARITETVEEGSQIVARLVAQTITKNPALRLGLAAGKSPIGLYRTLVNLHQSAELDYSKVWIFSLDELLGLPHNSPHSYHTFFHHHLLNRVKVDPTHLYLLNRQTDKDLASYCASYERLISEYGGIDLQILGIGRNGPLGLKDPGSSLNS